MYYPSLDPHLAQEAYAERLQRAEKERLAYEFLANRPKLQHRLREHLANWLIHFGERLKGQSSSELALEHYR